jgi:hypothetical protein
MQPTILMPPESPAGRREAPPLRGWKAVAAGLSDQRLFLGLVAMYVVSGVAVGQALQLPRLMRHIWFPYSYVLYASVALCAVPVLLAWCRWTMRDPEGRWIPGLAGWAAAWREVRARFFNQRRLTEVIALVLAVPLLMNALGGWKSVIPRLHPFSWDVPLDRLDRALHFGRLPWEWLQPWLGHPGITNALDSAYYAWFIVAILMVVGLAWSTERALRSQFFLSFALAWILLGTVLATLLSSAGPCYYTGVTGLPSPYAPLMEYLYRVNAHHPLIALFGQRVLWEDYIGQVDNPFNGISAMPSLHVAMPVLFALAAWRVHRALGIALGIYAFSTLLGSVLLGWHYAVDGYVGIVGMIGIWLWSGRLVAEQAR